MGRDGEKKHYNSLDREQDNIEDMDYSGNMNGKLEASEVLSYFVEGDKYFSTESRVNSILAETDPEKRREKIRKEVKKFFKNVFGVKSPEVATFFVQYVTEHMNLEDDKKEVTNEVLQEIRALLGKEFGDIIPHKSQEKYMDAAGVYLKKKGIGDFEKPGAFSGLFKRETEEEKQTKKTKEELTILKYTKPENVLQYLSDVEGTGDLASKYNKKLVVTAQQLNQAFKNLEATIGEKILLGNISYIMSKATGIQNLNFNTKQDLHTFLNSNPNAKNQFLEFVLQRARMRIDMNELFTDPKNALKRTVDIQTQINTDPTLKATTENIGKMMEGKLDDEIRSFEKRIASATGQEKKFLENSLAYIKNPENKKSIIDSFKVKAGGVFYSRLKDFKGREVHQSGRVVSITEKEKGHSSLVGGITIGNDELNKYLKEYVKIFDDFSFDIGVGMVDGKPHIGIGPRLSGKRNMTENATLKYAVGTYLLLPYAAVGFDYVANSGSINNLRGVVGKDIDMSSAHLFGGSINVSPVSAGAGVYWSVDKLKGIENKRKFLDKALSQMFTAENLNKDPNALYAELQKSDVGSQFAEDDKQSFIEIMKSAKQAIDTFDDFKLLTPEQRNNFIATNLKDAYVNRWHDYALVKAEKDGWHFGGLFLGVQLWLNFFPSASLFPDFKKVNVEFVSDKKSEATNIGKKLTGAGARELAGTEKDFVRQLEDLLNANTLAGKCFVTIENGRIVISGKNPNNPKQDSGQDPLTFLSVKYAPGVKNQIQYDGKRLVLGNIAPIIMPYHENKISGRKVTLFLGGNSEKQCTESMDLQNNRTLATEFANHNPEAIPTSQLTGGSMGSEGSKGLESNTNIDRDFGEYLRKNINKFVGFQWVHVKDYPAFMRAYTAGNYSQATDSLISMILTDKSLKKDPEIHQFATKIGQLKSFPKGTPESETLEVLLSQVVNAFMVDANTKDKIISPEQRRTTALHYVEDVFAKNPSIRPGKQEVSKAVEECLADPANFEKYRSMFSSLMAYQQDQDILKNSAKKLYFLLRPTIDFRNERRSAFASIATKDGLNTPHLNTYIDDLYKIMGEGGNNSWTTSNANNLLVFSGSYKLNRQNTGRDFSGFAFTPTGVTDIAVNQKTGKKAMLYMDESDVAAKTWVVNKLSQIPAWNNFKQSVFGIIGVTLNDNDFKKLLIDGSINIAGQELKFDRKFAACLRGPCLNEAFGIEIGTLTTRNTTTGKLENKSVSFQSNGGLVINTPVAEQKSFLTGVTTSDFMHEETPKTHYVVIPPQPEIPCVDTMDIKSRQGLGDGTGGGTVNK